MNNERARKNKPNSPLTPERIDSLVEHGVERSFLEKIMDIQTGKKTVAEVREELIQELESK